MYTLVDTETNIAYETVHSTFPVHPRLEWRLLPNGQPVPEHGQPYPY